MVQKFAFLALFGVACVSSFGRLKIFWSPVGVPCLAIWVHSLGKLSGALYQAGFGKKAVQELVQPLCWLCKTPVRGWSLLVLGAMYFLAVAGRSTRPWSFPPQKGSQLGASANIV